MLPGTNPLPLLTEAAGSNPGLSLALKINSSVLTCKSRVRVAQDKDCTEGEALSADGALWAQAH